MILKLPYLSWIRMNTSAIHIHTYIYNTYITYTYIYSYIYIYIYDLIRIFGSEQIEQMWRADRAGSAPESRRASSCRTPQREKTPRPRGNVGTVGTMGCESTLPETSLWSERNYNREMMRNIDKPMYIYIYMYIYICIYVYIYIHIYIDIYINCGIFGGALFSHNLNVILLTHKRWVILPF